MVTVAWRLLLRFKTTKNKTHDDTWFEFNQWQCMAWLGLPCHFVASACMCYGNRDGNITEDFRRSRVVTDEMMTRWYPRESLEMTKDEEPKTLANSGIVKKWSPRMSTIAMIYFAVFFAMAISRPMPTECSYSNNKNNGKWGCGHAKYTGCRNNKWVLSRESGSVPGRYFNSKVARNFRPLLAITSQKNPCLHFVTKSLARLLYSTITGVAKEERTTLRPVLALTFFVKV